MHFFLSFLCLVIYFFVSLQQKLKNCITPCLAPCDKILANARKRAYTVVNFAMVESYWLIGQQIVEHEQHGEARADYGKGLLKELAARLTTDFGKGFDESNLRYMRLFYRCFPKRDTLRHELTWSHYLESKRKKPATMAEG